MIFGAVQITRSSVRYSAVSRAPGVPGTVTAGFRELTAREGGLEEVEEAVVEAVEAVRETGVEEVGLFASGELRGTRFGNRLSVRTRRLGLGELRFTGSGAAIAATFFSQAESANLVNRPGQGGLACGVLGIGHHSVGLAVGRVGERPSWSGSRPIGVSRLAERARPSDPPRQAQLEAALSAAERSLGTLACPGFGQLVSISDFSQATRILCGDRADADSLGDGLASAAGTSAEELGTRVGLGPVLAPLLPMAIAIQLGAVRTFGADLIALDPDPAGLLTSRAPVAGA